MDARRPPPGGARGERGEPGAATGGSAGLAALLREFRHDARRSWDSLRRVVAVEQAALKWRALDILFVALLALWALGVGLAASVAASLLLVQGLRLAFVAWGQAEWLADLEAGAAALALLGLAILL